MAPLCLQLLALLHSHLLMNLFNRQSTDSFLLWLLARLVVVILQLLLNLGSFSLQARFLDVNFDSFIHIQAYDSSPEFGEISSLIDLSIECLLDFSLWSSDLLVDAYSTVFNDLSHSLSHFFLIILNQFAGKFLLSRNRFLHSLDLLLLRHLLRRSLARLLLTFCFLTLPTIKRPHRLAQYAISFMLLSSWCIIKCNFNYCIKALCLFYNLLLLMHHLSLLFDQFIFALKLLYLLQGFLETQSFFFIYVLDFSVIAFSSLEWLGLCLSLLLGFFRLMDDVQYAHYSPFIFDSCFVLLVLDLKLSVTELSLMILHNLSFGVTRDSGFGVLSEVELRVMH